MGWPVATEGIAQASTVNSYTDQGISTGAIFLKLQQCDIAGRSIYWEGTIFLMCMFLNSNTAVDLVLILCINRWHKRNPSTGIKFAYGVKVGKIKEGEIFLKFDLFSCLSLISIC